MLTLLSSAGGTRTLPVMKLPSFIIYCFLISQTGCQVPIAGSDCVVAQTPPTPRACTLPAPRLRTVAPTSTVTWLASPSADVTRGSTSTTWPAPPPWPRGRPAPSTSTACWPTGASGVSRGFVSAARTTGQFSSAAQEVRGW